MIRYEMFIRDISSQLIISNLETGNSRRVISTT